MLKEFEKKLKDLRCFNNLIRDNIANAVALGRELGLDQNDKDFAFLIFLDSEWDFFPMSKVFSEWNQDMLKIKMDELYESYKFYEKDLSRVIESLLKELESK